MKRYKSKLDVVRSWQCGSRFVTTRSGEETLLFNQLNNELCVKAYSDHALIKSIIKSMSKEEISAEVLQGLADQIDNHIRFEERILFTFLEIFYQRNSCHTSESS